MNSTFLDRPSYCPAFSLSIGQFVSHVERSYAVPLNTLLNTYMEINEIIRKRTKR